MRRRDGIAGSVAVAAVLLVVSGCGSASVGTSAPDARGSAPAAAASGSAAASGPAGPADTPSADATTADTHQVCGAIFQTVSAGASAVGTDLGAMVGHLSGANDSAAGASRDSALRKLGDLATQVRTAGAPALDPVVRTAAGETADRLQALAADPGLLTGVKEADQLDPVLSKITTATDPLTTACS
jgi:hypothetical protein